MDRREALALLAASAPAMTQSGPQHRVVGSWKLQASERTFRDGHKEYHFGRNPVGRIVYEKSGKMFALAMRPGRPSTLAPGMDLDGASETDLRNAVTGFTAYIGTYSVDEANQTLIHHVQAHLNPSSVGTDMKRKFHFEGRNLVLTRVSPDGSSSDRMVFEPELD